MDHFTAMRDVYRAHSEAFVFAIPLSSPLNSHHDANITEEVAQARHIKKIAPSAPTPGILVVRVRAQVKRAGVRYLCPCAT